MTKQEITDLNSALDDFLFALTLDMPDAQSLEEYTTEDAGRRWENFLTLKATVRNLYLEANN